MRGQAETARRDPRRFCVYRRDDIGNKDLFAAKGISYPKGFDEIVSAAVKLNDPAKGVSGMVARGLKNANVPVWASLMLGYGGDLFDKNGRLATDSPEAIAGAEMYKRLLRESGPACARSRRRRTIRRSRSASSSRSRPAAISTSSRGPSSRGFPKRSASRSSSRTRAAPAASSVPNMRRSSLPRPHRCADPKRGISVALKKCD